MLIAKPSRRSAVAPNGDVGDGGSAYPIADIAALGHTKRMRAYIIDPSFETFGQEDERTSAAINLVAEIVFRCLRSGGDTFQYALVWANPGEEPGGIWDSELAVPHVVRLDTDAVLREWLRRSVNPNTGGGGSVRSIATCRAVTFGYDGQALLCLRHEDAPPVSPDLTLAIVEERPDLLGGTDWFDGWLKDEPHSEDANDG
jgi:hypothetical protein